MQVQWNEAYSVGVAHLDEQHKVLFKLLDDLNESTYTSDFKNVSKRILDELMNYITLHFDEEEQFMAEIGYPKYEGHCRQHEDLRQKVRQELELHADEGYSTLKVMHLHQTILNWILEHIIQMDSQYANYERERKTQDQ